MTRQPGHVSRGGGGARDSHEEHTGGHSASTPRPDSETCYDCFLASDLHGIGPANKEDVLKIPYVIVIVADYGHELVAADNV